MLNCVVNLLIEWCAIITNKKKVTQIYISSFCSRRNSVGLSWLDFLLFATNIGCTGLYTSACVCVVCILYIHGPHRAPWECVGIPAIIQLCFFFIFPKFDCFRTGGGVPEEFTEAYTGTEERQCDTVHVRIYIPLQFNLIWLTALYVSVLRWLTAVYIHPTLRYARHTHVHMQTHFAFWLFASENMADRDLSSVKSIVPYDLISLVGVFTIVLCDNCEIQYPNLSSAVALYLWCISHTNSIPFRQGMIKSSLNNILLYYFQEFKINYEMIR